MVYIEFWCCINWLINREIGRSYYIISLMIQFLFLNGINSGVITVFTVFWLLTGFVCLCTFDFPFGRLFGVRKFCYYPYIHYVCLSRCSRFVYPVVEGIRYALSCNFSQVTPIFFNFKGAHFCSNKTKLYYKIRTISY